MKANFACVCIQCRHLSQVAYNFVRLLLKYTELDIECEIIAKVSRILKKPMAIDVGNSRYALRNMYSHEKFVISLKFNV